LVYSPKERFDARIRHGPRRGGGRTDVGARERTGRRGSVPPRRSDRGLGPGGGPSRMLAGPGSLPPSLVSIAQPLPPRTPTRSLFSGPTSHVQPDRAAGALRDPTLSGMRGWRGVGRLRGPRPRGWHARTPAVNISVTLRR